MLQKTWLCGLLSLISLLASADTTHVANIDELNRAGKTSKPGDVVVLRNGSWKDVHIALTTRGTLDHPIVFKAETPGKVRITGNSHLKVSGSFLVVDGWYFTDGHSGRESVISFRKGADAVAENCRVTRTVIDGFNNPSRLQENQWVALYGKYNRIDHCSFLDKRNLGVLLAVMLDDEHSRENHHRIEDNYFGIRVPLASNGGEIIRVGLSEHCQYNSNTRIIGNTFEHCDGEAEVISIKSGSNLVRGNLFRECQGSVVLRHGDNNTVEDNLFLGNGKQGTGGVRIINKGQWVVNNHFYKCTGTGFRAPLCIMNGVPNSPPIRYVEVSDAVIANNSFYDCAPMSLCEGSDAERSATPHDVDFLNNLFYHSKQTRIAESYDDVSRIRFLHNTIGGQLTQNIGGGFQKQQVSLTGMDGLTIPMHASKAASRSLDSLKGLARERLRGSLSETTGVSDPKALVNTYAHASKTAGAPWYLPGKPKDFSRRIECRTAEAFIKAISGAVDGSLSIVLTGDAYAFDAPVTLRSNTVLTASHTKPVRLSIKGGQAPFLLQVAAGHSLTLKGLVLDLSGLEGRAFLSTDTSGLSGHTAFTLQDCTIRNLAGTFLQGAKSSVTDSIRLSRCRFSAMKGPILRFDGETDGKGYYNVERMFVDGCVFTDCGGPLLAMLRSGKDESTMGPQVFLAGNQFNRCHSGTDAALISLKGVQVSLINGNSFTDCTPDGNLIEYQDWVRAAHVFRDNRMQQSGVVRTNAYVSLR